jgi:curved DNA-binding protein CbpA
MTIQQAIEILKPEDHTVDSLKRAYRAAAKLYHPDVNPNGL